MKHSRKTARRQSNTAAFLPFFTSAVSIALCALCLAGSSWAWFTADSSTGMSEIRAAETFQERKPEVVDLAAAATPMLLSVDGDETSVAPPSPFVEVHEDPNGYGFLAKANTPYSVSASLGGTANGYLRVVTCDGVYVTTDIAPTFILMLSTESWVSISASWGFPEMGCIFFTGDMTVGKGSFVPGCDCVLKCIDGANPLCAVCSDRPSECTGKLPTPAFSVLPQTSSDTATDNSAPKSSSDTSETASLKETTQEPPSTEEAVISEPPKCSCDFECKNGVLDDPNCEVCTVDGECTGIPWVTPCTCTVHCEDDNVDTGCPICPMNGIDACAAKPAVVECICSVRCSLDWHNKECPVCGFDGIERCRAGEITE